MESEPKSPSNLSEVQERTNERGFFRYDPKTGKVEEISMKEATDSSVVDEKLPEEMSNPQQEPGLSQESQDTVSEPAVESPAIFFERPTAEDFNSASVEPEKKVPEIAPTQPLTIPDATEDFDVEFKEPTPQSVEGIDQLLAAEDIDSFIKICDQLQAEGKSILIKEQKYSGAYIKKTLEMARDTIASGKKLIKAAEQIGALPPSELRTKIEKLLKVDGVMEAAQAVDTAYTQAA